MIRQFNRHKPFNYTLIGFFVVFISLEVQSNVNQMAMVPEKVSLVADVAAQSIAVPENLDNHPLDQQIVILEEILNLKNVQEYEN